MANTPLLSVKNILSMADGNNEGQLSILELAFRTELGLGSDKNKILAKTTLTQLTYCDVTSFFGAAAAATATFCGHNYNLRSRK